MRDFREADTLQPLDLRSSYLAATNLYKQFGYDGKTKGTLDFFNIGPLKQVEDKVVTSMASLFTGLANMFAGLPGMFRSSPNPSERRRALLMCSYFLLR